MRFPGSARVSSVGDGVPASADFCARRGLAGKIVAVRHRNQHEGRVRYP